MIEFEHVTKQFKTVVAVKDASFTIPTGKVTALIGANGSGKTTSMRMISTILSPTKGNITIDGFDTVKNTKEVRKKIGLMLGGDTALVKRFSARENILYYAELQGMTKKDAIARVEELVKLLKIESYIDKRVETFSRGMRQKVLFAQTLVHNPSILLLDEPSTGLDIFSTIEIQNIIQQCHNIGKDIIISSHNMSEIDKLCNYALIIDKGEILYSGDIALLKQKFHTTTIQDAFVGITKGRM